MCVRVLWVTAEAMGEACCLELCVVEMWQRAVRRSAALVNGAAGRMPGSLAEQLARGVSQLYISNMLLLHMYTDYILQRR